MKEEEVSEPWIKRVDVPTRWAPKTVKCGEFSNFDSNYFIQK
jgi:hypothetical protein